MRFPTDDLNNLGISKCAKTEILQSLHHIHSFVDMALHVLTGISLFPGHHILNVILLSSDGDAADPPTLQVPPPLESHPAPPENGVPAPAEYLEPPTPPAKQAGGCCAVFTRFKNYFANLAINPQGKLSLVPPVSSWVTLLLSG